MSACLCNLSADTILELIALKGLDVSLASPDPSSFVPDYNLVRDVLGTYADMLQRPIEFLVNNARNRRRLPGTACHVWTTPLPPNSVLSLGEGLYVCSPEFTLLQQASQLHQANLCQMLGRYLGIWSPINTEQGTPEKRAPLTCFESLNGFLTGANHSRGKGNLKLAMAYTCDGAASAPETSLQLALSLPPELHGLFIPQPTMNYEIGLSSQAQRLYPHETIRIDLCWPRKKFGLEYQGDEHGARLGADYARWYATRAEGYELWYLAKEQLGDAEQMSHIGREVAKRIGHEINEDLWPTTSELQGLLDVLTHRRHLGPLGYDELRRRRAK